MSPPRHQIVLLGASNLTRGISTVVTWLKANGFGPFDLYVAFGYGRSFGIASKVWGRILPGIKDSAIWSALAARSPAEQAAPHWGLITDIGNDLFYQMPVDEIVAWLRDALSRLRSMNAAIILVQIPLGNVERVSDFQFFVLSRILFPGRNLQKNDVRARAYRLGTAIETLAQEFGATLVTQNPIWYGFDRIHYRMRFWREAWPLVLRSWLGRAQDAAVRAKPAIGQWIYLRALVPHERRIFGVTQRRRQPAGELADGSRIFVY